MEFIYGFIDAITSYALGQVVGAVMFGERALLGFLVRHLALFGHLLGGCFLFHFFDFFLLPVYASI